MRNYKLNKKEILSSKKQIETLFLEGKSFYNSPIRILYIIRNEQNETKYPVNILFAVPKKYVKTAVKRNLIKRKLKEAYRKNKKDLVEFCMNRNVKINIACVYSTNIIADYGLLEEKIILSLQKIINDIENN